ncbi:hypothetical protein BST81_14790 [Leptolyngbya sp. 'hensonii']|uniref:dihydrofolate reductase n=1 Tax=Leptolyngbya sp. 'hensonii' TaxID=1922337 RepID=UPI0009502C85|nr:dihydrofolate reductase [Leptolyngbya sp. 'hensonii']OLP17589.1 hypothetical protein BST81_14790 [Leptolyngbya sp. 'hensonii']
MSQPEIIIIAALAETNRVMGNNGKLPWSIPADLQRFRHLTLGHPVIMGRKTWEFDLGQRPLPQRRNIILTSTPAQYQAAYPPHLPSPKAIRPVSPASELYFASSLEAAIALASNHLPIFIAGGASVYAQALPLADRMELTLIEGDFAGDTVFPDYTERLGHMTLVQEVAHPGYRFVTYQRL